MTSKTKIDRDNEMLAAIDARNCVESVTSGDELVLSFKNTIYEDAGSSAAMEIFNEEIRVAFNKKKRQKQLQNPAYLQALTQAKVR